MPEPLFTDSKGREVAAPPLGGPLADTHAHLDMLEDPAGALAHAARAHVGFIATVADPSEDASRTYGDLPGWLASAERALAADGFSREDAPLPRVRIIVGVHPHNAKDLTPEVETELVRLARRAETCAIGEIGLDYHYDLSPREQQRDAFRRQLLLAHEFNLPAVIHLREAHDDGLLILAEAGLPSAGCILHCYTLGPDVLGAFLDLGCMVSFAGPVTFKKAGEVLEAARVVPLDRILAETDCPFMTPEPFRGRKNEPAFVVFSAAKMAEARGEDPVTFAAATYASSLRLLDGVRS
ncbi:MAG: TatD family hydrolase [Coriobacteriia bacterium]|nr:TatD family hydrolase [Coriobacteriia bacterium]